MIEIKCEDCSETIEVEKLSEDGVDDARSEGWDVTLSDARGQTEVLAAYCPDHNEDNEDEDPDEEDDE